MTSTSIKVAFVDFWPAFDARSYQLVQQLSAHFPIELSDEPDYLFFSVFGSSHLEPRFDRCIKIICLAENVRPNFSVHDYSISFDYLDNSRNLRLPYYSNINFYLERELNKYLSLVKPDSYDPVRIQSSKTKFCNFVCSNEWARERLVFLEMLSEYKQVDSGGAVRNNLGFRVQDKIKFMEPYKFTIAFENSSYPGYVTEKLVDPMFANSLPIYWGSPRVNEEFNPQSFINCHEHTNWRSVIDKIIQIDRDDSLYLEYLKSPWFHGNKPNLYCQPDYIIPFFQMVFTDKKPRTKRPTVIVTVPGHNPRWEITM